MIRRKIALAATCVAIAIGGTVATAAPAFAAYDKQGCTAYIGFCATDVIPSHSTQHWVSVYIVTSLLCGADWELRDEQNGHVVASGHVSAYNSYGQTVYGLYSEYYLFIDNTCYNTYGQVANYTT